MIKDLIVNLGVGASRDVAAEFAVSVAVTFDAHVTGIAFVYEPLIPVADMSYIPPNVVESLWHESREAAKSAVSRFDEACRAASVPAASQLVDATEGGGVGLFARMARRFDLAVTAQPQSNKPMLGDLTTEAALFGTGRPVIVVPYIQRSGLKLERVLVCWDGSRCAARAVADAMPWLVRAKATEIVMVASEPAKSDELPGADIAHHLARHSVKVDLKRIDSTGTDVGSTILSYAADVSADLLVMGGYGHSRLREFILGGVTRGILSAMTVPTLMSH